MIVEAICVGRPDMLPGGKRSAIAKYPVQGPATIGQLGIVGDTQADTRHHGGPEMAVHLYPLSHHAFWRERIGNHPLLDEPGAFGGNLAIANLDETHVRLGERFRLGSTVIEISQPRMPCATIEHRFQRTGMVEAILETGRCGWYFRVVQEGVARAGDLLEPVAGTGTAHSVRAVFLALADPKGPIDHDLVSELAACPLLTADWRAKATTKLRRRAL